MDMEIADLYMSVKQKIFILTGWELCYNCWVLDEDENKGCKLMYSLQAQKWHLLRYVCMEKKREGKEGGGGEEAGKNMLPHTHKKKFQHIPSPVHWFNI